MIQVSSGSGRPKVPSKGLGPTVRIQLSVTLDCELLDGDVADLAAIAGELAGYLERRDEHIGMIAASEWALLVRRARVRCESESPTRGGDIVDARPSRRAARR